MIIGGVIGALGGGAFAYELCRNLNETNDSCVWSALGGAAGGAVVLGLVGALIGGQFPKEPESTAPADSTAADTTRP